MRFVHNTYDSSARSPKNSPTFSFLTTVSSEESGFEIVTKTFHNAINTVHRSIIVYGYGYSY